jgi:hypothetical protein
MSNHDSVAAAAGKFAEKGIEKHLRQPDGLLRRLDGQPQITYLSGMLATMKIDP